jgi:DNA-binding CsgD family transcriptional regulator
VVLARHLSNSTPQPLSRAIAAYRKLDLSGRNGSRARSRAPKRALRLNAKQVERLIVSYQAGATVYELANQFYIDRRTVSIHLKRRGVAFRYQPPSPQVIDTMARLYASGHSLASVGKQVGMNASSVRAHLRERGARTRDTHGRNVHDSLQPDSSLGPEQNRTQLGAS